MQAQEGIPLEYQILIAPRQGPDVRLSTFGQVMHPGDQLSMYDMCTAYAKCTVHLVLTLRGGILLGVVQTSAPNTIKQLFFVLHIIRFLMKPL